MNYQKGDRVKFLNDVGGGIIQSSDNKTAIVMRDDGFEIPVRLSELILVERMQNNELSGHLYEEEEVEILDVMSQSQSSRVEPADNQPETEEELPESGRNPAFSLYYSIVPRLKEKSKTEQFDFYLINDSEFILLFNIMEESEGFYRSLQHGTLEAGTKVFIKQFSRDDLNEFPKLKIQALFLRKGFYQSHSPLHKDIAPEPSLLFSYEGFKENDFFEEEAFVCPVLEESPCPEYEKSALEALKSAVKEKEAKNTTTSARKEPLPDTEEVDLHIHELVDNYAGMSNGEILEIQLARFHTTLLGALKSGTKRIIFIHGVGNGKLKFEIRRELDKKYPRLKYQDASFKEYGFGATLVLLRK